MVGFPDGSFFSNTRHPVQVRDRWHYWQSGRSVVALEYCPVIYNGSRELSSRKLDSYIKYAYELFRMDNKEGDP